MVSAPVLGNCSSLLMQLFLKNKLDQFLHPGGSRVQTDLLPTCQSSSGHKKTKKQKTKQEVFIKQSDHVSTTLPPEIFDQSVQMRFMQQSVLFFFTVGGLFACQQKRQLKVR